MLWRAFYNWHGYIDIHADSEEEAAQIFDNMSVAEIADLTRNLEEDYELEDYSVLEKK